MQHIFLSSWWLILAFWTCKFTKNNTHTSNSLSNPCHWIPIGHACTYIRNAREASLGAYFFLPLSRDLKWFFNKCIMEFYVQKIHWDAWTPSMGTKKCHVQYSRRYPFGGFEFQCGFQLWLRRSICSWLVSFWKPPWKKTYARKFLDQLLPF